MHNARLSARRFGRRTALALLAAATLALPLAGQAAGNGFEVIHHFTGAGGTGGAPYAGLVQSPDGRFHGTAYDGGKSRWGDVFRLTRSGQLSVQYSFRKRDAGGYHPGAGLVLASDGNFYGAARNGGSQGYGTLYRITPDGQLSVVHTFAFSGDGGFPSNTLMQASDGNLYGTAEGGCCGTVFRMSLAGDFQTVRSFDVADGGYPSTLIEGTDGNFYGTTGERGAHGGGTVFRMTPAGALTVLHDFRLNFKDGYGAGGPLLLAADGNFYGVTGGGGEAGRGTVFRITPEGKVTILHSFAGAPADGALPHAGLIQATNGNFYGTTPNGGANDRGTVFRMRANGSLVMLHEFADTGGIVPQAPLLEASDGLLYGTAVGGGDFGHGTVFRIKAQ